MRLEVYKLACKNGQEVLLGDKIEVRGMVFEVVSIFRVYWVDGILAVEVLVERVGCRI